MATTSVAVVNNVALLFPIVNQQYCVKLEGCLS